MEVSDSFHKLLKEIACDSFFKRAFFLYKREEITMVNKLQNNEKDLGGLAARLNP